MSGWFYNMNSKSLVVIADRLIADEAMLSYYYSETLNSGPPEQGPTPK